MPLPGVSLTLSDNDVHACDQILKSLPSVHLKKGSCLSCVMRFYFQNLHNHFSSHILRTYIYTYFSSFYTKQLPWISHPILNGGECFKVELGVNFRIHAFKNFTKILHHSSFMKDVS